MEDVCPVYDSLVGMIGRIIKIMERVWVATVIGSAESINE